MKEVNDLNILFYPDGLRRFSKLYHALSDLGIRFHNDIHSDFDLFFLWTYNKMGCEVDDFIRDNNPINTGCYDISKTKIAIIFDDIRVNPECYDGLVVRKSERQCSMDEVLIQCPTQRDDNFIYRRYINHHNGDGFVTYRLYYFNGIKFISSITNPCNLFSKDLNRSWKVESLDIIPLWRRLEIERDARLFGVDFGEIDVLFDVDDEYFYVIDVNNIAGSGGWGDYRFEDLRLMYNNELITFLKERYEDSVKK